MGYRFLSWLQRRAVACPIDQHFRWGRPRSSRSRGPLRRRLFGTRSATLRLPGRRRQHTGRLLLSRLQRGPWHLQQINCGPNSSNACPIINTAATSAAPPASEGPVVSLDTGHDQLHYTYKDKNGGVQDVFYCPGCDNGSWHSQLINAPGLTGGPAAAAAPFVSVYDGHDQQHFAYRDASRNLWDAYACPGCSDGFWHLQQVTPCGDMTAHMTDLTPNDAPCNAINKLVPGYLQAFKAVPAANGQLKELWNSDESPGDAIRSFAKRAPRPSPMARFSWPSLLLSRRKDGGITIPQWGGWSCIRCTELTVPI